MVHYLLYKMQEKSRGFQYPAFFVFFFLVFSARKNILHTDLYFFSYSCMKEGQEFFHAESASDPQSIIFSREWYNIRGKASF
jgi:hypothetical protein